MRIGLSGGGSSVDNRGAGTTGGGRRLTSLWQACSVAVHPLVATAIAGRATATIELGAGVRQTYPRR